MSYDVYERVFATILDRKENPEEGSYTTYLFDKGLEKILKKLVRKVRKSSLPAAGRIKKM